MPGADLGGWPARPRPRRQFSVATPARVLIVDDQASIRALLRVVLDRDSRLVVVGEAGGASEAGEMIAALRPDVLILDVVMPGLNGLEFLHRVMKSSPLPVVMFSAVTRQGSVAAVRALAQGAVDCITKPQGGLSESFAEDFAERVFNAASVRRLHEAVAPATRLRSDGVWNGQITLVGSSTGGVKAIERLLSKVPEKCPPMVLAQHMPAQFLASFSERLNQVSGVRVLLAYDGMQLLPGLMAIAPGGATHCTVRRLGDKWRIRLTAGEPISGPSPSVDMLFQSALKWAQQTTAVLLTGMGRDGARAMRNLHDAGGYGLVQDAESCTVYGMPRAAMELNAADAQLDIDGIAAALCKRAFARAPGPASEP